MDGEALGGGSVSTNWAGMSVEQMWDLVRDHDGGPALEALAGWARTLELLDHHQRRVQEHRDRLAERWPPGTSPAAAGFLEQVDRLLHFMSAAKDAAGANGPALSHANAALVEAKARLAAVHQRWADNQAKLAVYDQQVALSYQHGGPPAFGVPPVSAMEQNAVQAQAVTVMTALGAQVLEAQDAMRPPPRYDPPRLGVDDPLNPGSSGSITDGGSHSTPRPPSGRPPVPPAPERSPGGVLSGAPSSLGQGRPSSTPAGVTGPGGPGAQPGTRSDPFAPVGRIIGYVPSPPGGATAQSPSRSGGGLGTVADWSSGRRALPPGGVIGEPPPPVPQRPPASGGPRRANPVGGLIGPTTGQEGGGMIAGPLGGGRPGELQRRQRNRAYDTNEHWPVPKGVPPVLQPRTDEPVHDPGPILGPHP
ncbi:MAG: hypothetical protein AUI14_19220 [Actinobacteria bacterium 13_2_20CM_2_71_6]|nr:MAG: hypothetical protein AUI14_19220 [Actinobacteria bacterium 13_2_20CM_2_71_6]